LSTGPIAVLHVRPGEISSKNLSGTCRIDVAAFVAGVRGSPRGWPPAKGEEDRIMAKAIVIMDRGLVRRLQFHERAS
jgi:hypothetical protein